MRSRWQPNSPPLLIFYLHSTADFIFILLIDGSQIKDGEFSTLFRNTVNENILLHFSCRQEIWTFLLSEAPY